MTRAIKATKEREQQPTKTATEEAPDESSNTPVSNAKVIN
jgi:hypothetical protein